MRPQSETATGLGARQGNEPARLGVVPNMYRSMALSQALLSTYLHGYEQIRSKSTLSRTEQEVVLLSTCLENESPYCVAAHSWLATNSSGLPQPVLEALREGGNLPDARLRVLSDFTRALMRGRGRPGTEAREAFFQAGFSEAELLEVVLVVGVKTLSNYATLLLGTPLDQPFEAFAWERPAER